MEVDHTGWNIFQVISESFKEFFFCHEKVFSITFDYASNNDVVAEILKESLELVQDAAFFQIRCVCHILNLAIQNGLQVLSTEIIPIR